MNNEFIRIGFDTEKNEFVIICGQSIVKEGIKTQIDAELWLSIYKSQAEVP